MLDIKHLTLMIVMMMMFMMLLLMIIMMMMIIDNDLQVQDIRHVTFILEK